MADEELNAREKFRKKGRRRWGGKELDEGKGFGLFTFWFGILDVRKQKKAEKQV